MSDYPSTEQILSEVSSEKPVETAQAEPKAAEASPWLEDEYEIEGGKKIKEPREMILKRAGLGYHAAQKLQYANQILEKYKGYDEKFAQLSRWQEYNDYAEKNPEWAKHVEETWNSRQNMQQSNQNPQAPFSLPPEVQQTLDELKRFRDETLSARQAEQIQKEDQAFVSEITETGKKYGVDLSQADEQGRSLEWQVLEHMKSMGMDGSKPGHFRAAFKDYYLDNLLERQKEQGKEEVAKNLEERRKAGILDVSRTPKASKSFDARNFSYEQLAEMAREDMRQAKKA